MGSPSSCTSPEGKKFAVISRQPTWYTNHRSDILEFSMGPDVGRVVLVPVAAYDKRYAEYNQREGISR